MRVVAPEVVIATQLAATLPAIRSPGAGRMLPRLIAPTNLHFGTGHDEVAGYADKIGRLYNGRQSLYLDFTMVREAGPAAALYVAAEIQRWQMMRSPWRLLRAHDLEDWDPSMRVYLRDLGLFRLLRVVNPPEEPSPPSEVRILPFRRNSGLETDEVLGLRDDLHELIGLVPQSKQFCEAISEAMNNVTHHAYQGPDAAGYPRLDNNWWMTADFSPVTGLLRVAFLDQGIGIPARLPLSGIGPRIAATLAGLGEKDHAGRIKTALEYGETSTEEPGRGKGFRDMQAFVDGGPDNWMRVLSGHGECVYRNGKVETARNHESAITGTIVEWAVVVPTAEQGSGT